MFPIIHLSSFENSVPYYLPSNQNKIKARLPILLHSKAFQTPFK